MTLFVGASESYDVDAWEAYNIKKENAALRTQLADVAESMGRVEERCAKLRELLWELYEDQCDECDRWKYRDRMRNLGVEVHE